LGYASSLFDLPEPFTAVAEENISVLWVSTDSRPFSGWPRDIISRLQEMLKAKTEYHASRTKNMQASISTSNGLKGTNGDHMPAEWTASDSPKLKYKELDLWRVETLRDRFDAEGWQGGQPVAVMSKSPKGSASPHGASATLTPIGSIRMYSAPASVHHSASALSSSSSPDLGQSKEPQRRHRAKANLSQEPASCAPRGGASVRGIYAVNSGLGRCKTPWGTWSPSGMLPPSQNPAGPGITGSRFRKKVMMGTRKDVGISQEEAMSSSQGKLRKVDLKCPSDWQQLSGVASSASLGKMFKQRLRHNTMQGPPGAFASSSSSMGHSFSEGALR